MMSALAENAARKRAELGDTPKRTVKQTMYLVKWAGLGYEHCTWETRQDIGNPGLIAAFHKLNNSYPDEPDMPEAAVGEVLNKENHINPRNAGGKFCIPDLRSQLYAQTRAFEFAKFALPLPVKVGTICGPKSHASVVSMDGSSQTEDDRTCAVLECVSDMVQRVARKDSLPNLMEIKKDLPPLMAGEYDVVVPITSKGLLMNVGEVHGSVSFLGYRTFPDGSKGPAEEKKLIHNVGDKIIAVDGNSTAGLSFKEVIGLLRESGKNQFSFMRFLDSRYTPVNGELTSVGSVGRYACTALQNKFTTDRKRLLVQRSETKEDETPVVDEAEESDGSADPEDSDDESEGSGDFQPDSEEEVTAPVDATEIVDHGRNQESLAAAPGVHPSSQKPDSNVEPKEDGPIIRSENTRSLAYRLLGIDVGYSSDEGGDEACAYFLDGVDDTFTAEAALPKDISDATEKDATSKQSEKEEETKLLPVKRNEFSALGNRAKLVASVSLTTVPPDLERFDKFPEPSSKAIEEKEAEEAAHANRETGSPDKPAKRSNVKVEQLDIATNEIIHVWANAGAAAATLQIPLNELKQVLQGDYDEELGDEVGGFRWRFAAAGATVTAGLEGSKKNKKGKRLGLNFGTGYTILLSLTCIRMATAFAITK